MAPSEDTPGQGQMSVCQSVCLCDLVKIGWIRYMPVDMEDWFMVLSLRKETKLNDELCLCCLTMGVFAIKSCIVRGLSENSLGRH